ncbi:MAG: Tex family protein [Aggregatilineales bacterium]
MPTKKYEDRVAHRLDLDPRQVDATIRLLDDGNTIPFIARYRKEMTLNLDEFLIRKIQETVTQMRVVDDRRETILDSITSQDKLTPALKKQLASAETMTELEDLYLPYRPKRRTRAGIARERGLDDLATLILEQPRNSKSPEHAAKAFLNEDVPTLDDALSGARDIVAETISDHAAVRGTLREKALEWATITSKRIKKSDDPKGTYETYYEFSGRVNYIKPYQILALNRGEREKILRVKVEIPERDWQDAIRSGFRPDNRSAWAQQLALAIEDAAKRLLLPAIERDVRRTLSDIAENHAIDVFAENLRNLLNQPPLMGYVVMGVDPAYRTGCKIAVVDDSGRVLATTAIYPHKPQGKRRESLATLATLIKKHRVSLIAIGNGTASRETEALIAELTREMDSVQYVMVNEAGASVYSASELARDELPDLDVTIRGAVSIARRLQDPLAELVKIDPQSIGVGMYQHDLNQKALAQSLDVVVESVVNQVGVDVNTASPALLAYVAGVGAKLAKNIVAYRDDNGAFKSRAALKKVSGLGAKSFEQAAGFLRVRDGRNPLDASAIHPESYNVAKSLLDRAGLAAKSDPSEREAPLKTLQSQTSIENLAKDLNTGALTLADIFEQLMRPGRDPRDDLPPPILRSDVLSMSDLEPGLRLAGTVRNVVDFGAFVDIGVKQDGLLHISKIPAGAAPGVGDVIQVEILSVDAERGRIGLGWID